MALVWNGEGYVEDRPQSDIDALYDPGTAVGREFLAAAYARSALPGAGVGLDAYLAGPGNYPSQVEGSFWKSGGFAPFIPFAAAAAAGALGGSALGVGESAGLAAGAGDAAAGSVLSTVKDVAGIVSNIATAVRAAGGSSTSAAPALTLATPAPLILTTPASTPAGAFQSTTDGTGLTIMAIPKPTTAAGAKGATAPAASATDIDWQMIAIAVAVGAVLLYAISALTAKADG